MGKIERLNIGDSITYATGFFSGEYDQELHLKRAKGEVSELPKYFIGVYSRINGQLVRQGYLYFYLDEENKKSYFIGAKVEEQFRDLNIGSFLVANWIDFCLNNGYEMLGVNKRQRKPFLIYLLKKFGFDVLDLTQYYLRNDIVTICCDAELHDKTKFLLFKDGRHEKTFLGTNIYKEDNYQIVHGTKKRIVPQVGDIIKCELGINIALLSDIILPLQNYQRNPADYELIDYDLAGKKVVKTLSKHRK